MVSDSDGWGVYDSRSGEQRLVKITDDQKNILDMLNRPATEQALHNQFGPSTDGALKLFRERGWLFEEGLRSLSLITPEYTSEFL